MSGNGSYLLDTNIVLFLLNGDKQLAEIVDGKVPYISFITEMELLSYNKLSIKEEVMISAFLSECRIIEMNSNIKALAIKIRKDYGLKLPDSIIAATREQLNMAMLTSDTDFNKLKSLHILQYEYKK